MRRFIAGAIVAAAVVAASPVAGMAQEAPQPAEYGQGAGVQRARSLPHTGGGPAEEPLTAAAAAGLVGAAGVALGARRELPR